MRPCYLLSMEQLIPIEEPDTGQLVTGFLGFMETTGLAEVVGGQEVLKAGIQELVKGALPLAAELVMLDSQGRDLADAVNDPETAPYASKVHGFMEDLLTLEVPGELLPWARRIVRMSPSEALTLRRTTTTLALRGTNPMSPALGRFFLFEALCIIQRFELLASGVQIEALGGRGRDVETIAERELAIAESAPAYGDALLDLDDPMGLLQMLGLVGLDGHLQALKAELAVLKKEMTETLERRRNILQVSEQLHPTDAILLLNETADEFGEERLSVRQLRARHPGHLGEVSDSAIWKRVERLPEKIQRRDSLQTSRTVPSPNNGPNLADLVMEVLKEENE